MAVITFAHRGARLVAPENTIPAFRVALEQGASGIETDVWLSKDGEVVCAHDPVVARGVRRRRISSATAAELSGYGIPRFAELYEELGSRYECSVDVKTADAAGGLIEVARAHDALERLWICSPDVALLRSLRQEEKRVKLVHSERRTAISAPLERHAFVLASAGIEAMNLHHTEWSAGLVSLFHRFEVRAFAWDTQEVRHLRAVLAMGIDAVYCDRPERMVAAVSEWVAE
ncbi:MAG TPA: glycerophosphodiester phosphodiesterase [Acidimicrobiia bacterium]